MMDIQTFANPAEVRALPNFVENNPLTKVSYKGLAGDYHFSEDVACCFQKDNGNLCLQLHRRGWLIELLDGTVTLLGNDCASMQFDLDSKLIADRSRYNNEKRRKERLASINHLIAQKSARLEELGRLRTSLESLKARANVFASEFGPITRRELIALARSDKPDVRIKGIKLRPYVDEQGVQRHERSVIQVTLGTLNGLDLVRPDSFYKLFEAMDDVARAHVEAELLGEKPKGGEVDRLTGRLGEFDRILREGKRLLALEASLFDNELLLLCYLVQEPAERDAIMVKLMNDAGLAGGRKKARAWFFEKAQALAAALGVDKIERY
ncbi:hypothetical protein B9P52_26415 [Achromobacter denitrificans]|uniref:hypothetical protein n=1 Tax=Achromobacter denitrificans TaxID=32002 RepID=UPI000B4C2EDC|nr:hypothetical protein [Achromobacter denitrificans]ASC67584.1 hypothetical protein B9P52_26415 [Achromobacter denitrificans]